ncbi:MAG: hypothetical protein U0610_04340 [bacterium]
MGTLLGVLYPTDFFDYRVAIGALVYVLAQRAARLWRCRSISRNSSTTARATSDSW